MNKHTAAWITRPFNAETLLGNHPVNQGATAEQGRPQIEREDCIVINVPESTPLVEIARAFATIGMTLRNEDGRLVAKREALDNPKRWENQRAINAAHAARRAAMTPEEMARVDESEARRLADLKHGE